MNPEKIAKTIDKSKINIGTELECFIVHEYTWQEMSRLESQVIFRSLIEKFNWQIRTRSHLEEIHAVQKKIFGHNVIIKLDLSYAILEIATPPVGSLFELEKLHELTLTELKESLRLHGLIIWPFGVAPVSSNLYNLTSKHKEEIIHDLLYRPMLRLDYQQRFCHITAHQVALDIPLEKIIPAMNALFRNLGTIIQTFANSPLRLGNIFHKEGRYYYWNDCHPLLHTARHQGGTKPFFPPRPFTSLHDLFAFIWKGEYALVMRNNMAHTFKDLSTSIERILREKKSILIDPYGNEVDFELTRGDINLFLHTYWLDFKPHFDLDEGFTLDEFIGYWHLGDLDTFFRKHTTHSYLEIRPCPPHLEENAMIIPRYFYKIFENLDDYIRESEKISWEEAKQKRDHAILA